MQAYSPTHLRRAVGTVRLATRSPRGPDEARPKASVNDRTAARELSPSWSALALVTGWCAYYRSTPKLPPRDPAGAQYCPRNGCCRTNMLIAGHPMTSPPGRSWANTLPGHWQPALSVTNVTGGAPGWRGPVRADWILPCHALGPCPAPGLYSAEAGTLGSRLSRRRIVGSGPRGGPASRRCPWQVPAFRNSLAARSRTEAKLPVES